MINKTTITTNLKNIHFSLRLGAWEFRPGLAPTVMVLIVLPLLLSLGLWQLHRAVIKQQLIDQFTQRAQQRPQPLSGRESVYQPVQVTGHYDPAHAILLDNRIVNHQVGYDVLLPFIPADGQPGILINLGWIPQSERAKQAGRDYSSETEQTIIGLVQIPQHQLVLAHPKTDLQWPLVVEDIRVSELSRFLNRPLYPFILLLSGNGGFTHHWDTVVSVSPARHRGYAVQWFALALTLIILYFRLNIHRIPHE